MNDLSRRELEAEIEMLQDEVQNLKEALREQYRLVDTYYADMTDEASDDLERHLISALNERGDSDA